MKRILPIMLIIALLCGCAMPKAPLPTEPTDAPAVRPAFYELRCLLSTGYQDLDLRGDRLAVVACAEFAPEQWRCELLLCDLTGDRILARRTLSEDNEDLGYSVRFTETGLVCWSHARETGTRFDPETLEPLAALEQGGPERTFFSDFFPGAEQYENYWQKEDGYAALIFPDAPNRLWLWEDPDEWYVNAMGERRALLNRTEWEGDTVVSNEFAVLDPEQGLLARLEIPEGQGWYYGYCVDADRAILTASGEGVSQSVCVWNYANNAAPEPVSIAAYTVAELEAETNRLADELQERYGVTFHYSANTVEMNGWDGVHPFGLTTPIRRQPYFNYCFTRSAEAVFRLFPDGMLREIYDVDWASGLDFYVVYSIAEETIGAFAGNMDGRIYAVFPGANGAYSIPHELMHCLEHRIFEILGRDFDDDWYALNPDGFEYLYGEERPENYDRYLPWGDDQTETGFASDYAMTNELEDRAVLFAELFSNRDCDAAPYWLNAPLLAAKADLLCRAIREAFPSAAAAEAGSLPWEAPLTAPAMDN